MHEHSCTSKVVTGATTRWFGSLLISSAHSVPGVGGTANSTAFSAELSSQANES